MKTVSERNAENETKREVERTTRSEQHKIWCEYVDAVEVLDFPIYVNNKPYRDRTDYAEARKGFRENVRRSGRVGFIDTTCDECDVVLWDDHPEMTLSSDPPKFWAVCVGCGASYALTTDLRCYLSRAQLPPPSGAG